MADQYIVHYSITQLSRKEVINRIEPLLAETGLFLFSGRTYRLEKKKDFLYYRNYLPY